MISSAPQSTACGPPSLHAYQRRKSKYDNRAMQVTAIIAAAGSGRRFGGPELKQLIPIRGRAILEWSVAAFVGHPSIHEVVVAVPQQLVDDPPPYLRNGPKTVRVVC